jgi:hypothetical protein
MAYKRHRGPHHLTAFFMHILTRLPGGRSSCSQAVSMHELAPSRALAAPDPEDGDQPSASG